MNNFHPLCYYYDNNNEKTIIKEIKICTNNKVYTIKNVKTLIPASTDTGLIFYKKTLVYDKNIFDKGQ